MIHRIRVWLIHRLGGSTVPMKVHLAMMNEHLQREIAYEKRIADLEMRHERLLAELRRKGSPIRRFTGGNR